MAAETAQEGLGWGQGGAKNHVTTQTTSCEDFGDLSVPWEQLAKLERKEKEEHPEP